MHLASPAVKYKESFLGALTEYQKEKLTSGRDILALDPTVLQNNFESYINQLVGESFGKNLPKGYVSHTTYWLINKNEFIGQVDIRHSLTEKLLREGGHIGYNIRPLKRNQGYGKRVLELALPKAKALGLTNVLITCDEGNIASKKIIEANGGVFENSIVIEKGRHKKLRYWITLK